MMSWLFIPLYHIRAGVSFSRLTHINGIPSKPGTTARAWFYGKLLLAGPCEKVVNEGRFPPVRKRRVKEGA
jgi:hypothetical protein